MNPGNAAHLISKVAGYVQPDRIRMHPDTWLELVQGADPYYTAPTSDGTRTFIGYRVELDESIPYPTIRVEHDVVPSK